MATLKGEWDFNPVALRYFVTFVFFVDGLLFLGLNHPHQKKTTLKRVCYRCIAYAT